MFKKVQLIVLTIVCFLFLSSCEKTEFLEDVVFDNSLLNGISFNVAEKKINIIYESTFNEPFVDHVMVTSPTARVISWLKNNINNFGTMNEIVINIQKASITRKEIVSKVEVKGIIKKQNEYLYEIIFEILYFLYNDSNQILATTKAEVFRSTTSSQFISLNERNLILDNITLEALRDLSNKSVELLKVHMSEHVL